MPHLTSRPGLYSWLYAVPLVAWRRFLVTLFMRIWYNVPEITAKIVVRAIHSWI